MQGLLLSSSFAPSHFRGSEGFDLRLTVLGNLTIDEIVNQKGVHVAPGGPAYHVSRAAAYLGAKVRLVSNIGRDYPGGMLSSLSRAGVDLRDVERDIGSTTRFKLSYTKGTRRIWLLERGRQLSTVKRIGRPDAIHIGPVFGEAKAEDFKTFRASTNFLSVDVQGLLREGGRGGRVRLVERNLRSLLAICDAVKASEEEARLISHRHDPISAVHQIQHTLSLFILLTRGGKGMVLGVPPDRVYAVPSYPEKNVVDPTGAGDIMMAGWLHTYLSTKDPLWAASVGSAFASLSVRKYGPGKFQVSREELLKRSAFVHRNIRPVA